MTVNINQQEYLITISTENGPRNAVGHLASINNFPVTLHIKPKGKQCMELVVSDVRKGVKLRGITINPIEFWMADTKERTLELYAEKLEGLCSFMTPEMIEEINLKRAAHPEVPEPVQTIIDTESGWKEQANE